MPSDPLEKLFQEISGRLVKKEHAELLNSLMESLRQEGEKGVKKTIKDMVLKVKET